MRLTQVARQKALVRPAQVELLAGTKMSWAQRYAYSKPTWVMMSIERIVEKQGRHLTS